jgi:hypothetical protein
MNHVISTQKTKEKQTVTDKEYALNHAKLLVEDRS